MFGNKWPTIIFMLVAIAVMFAVAAVGHELAQWQP